MDTICIPLTKGETAIIDECDADLALLKWYCGPSGYAARGTRSQAVEKYTTIFLHRVVATRLLGGIPKGIEVDHINGVRLDCRRANLRLANNSQNAANRASTSGSTSRYRGVCWKKSLSKWAVKIGHKHIGYFADEVDAAKAADAAALIHFGEYARLNFPQDAVGS